MTKLTLLEKVRQQRYLYGNCQMSNYEPQNEDLFYSIDETNVKDLFTRLKEAYKTDKKAFIKNYKAITEMEMFINWKSWYYSEIGEYSKSDIISKIRIKMHDFNGNKFDYGTDEGKYYFNTLD